jgi:gamma-glutamyltranspeptidase/glutathione hydrolase/leukotriene-C4 hydrolase
MTIYDPAGPQARSLDAREVAPIAATEDMFKREFFHLSKRYDSFLLQNNRLKLLNCLCAGGLAVAVPSELAGSWAAHQEYGKLPWSRLVLPTAEMVEKGIPVINSHLANSLQEFQKIVIDEPSMR